VYAKTIVMLEAQFTTEKKQEGGKCRSNEWGGPTRKLNISINIQRRNYKKKKGRKKMRRGITGSGQEQVIQSAKAK